jgi:hypothetical protein
MKSSINLGTALVIGLVALGGCAGGGGSSSNSNSGGLFGSKSESTPAGGIKAGAAASGNGSIQSIEPVSQDGKTIQRFTIRMDSGGARQTVTNATTAGFSVGDRVRIENGMMTHRN